MRAPAREGATFLGWQDETGARVSGLPEYTLTMGRAPISLTAQWAEHAALQSGEGLMAALGDERARTLALAADVTVTEVKITWSVSLDLKGYSLLGEAIVITGSRVRIFGGRMTFSGSEGISFTGKELKLERLTLDAPNGTALTFAGEKLSVIGCTVRGGAYGVWLLQGSGEMKESAIAGSVGASVVVGNCLAGKYPENAQCRFSRTQLENPGGVALFVLSDLADGTSAQASFACNDVLAAAFAAGQIVASEGAAVERLHGELRRVARQAATCVAEGTAEHHVCDDCGALFVLQEGSYYEVTAEELTLPATGEHVFPDEDYSDYIPPTCTEDGHAAGRQCANCDAWYGGAEPAVIEALGHDWTEWVEDRDSCDVAGERTRTCNRCQEVESEQLSAGQHSWDDGVITKAPTCTTTGVKTKACELCDATTTETVPATGHKRAALAAVDPTCTTTGLTAGERCTACGLTFTAQQIIPATGHDMEYHAAVAPTEAAGGNIEYWQCKTCGVCYTDAEGKTEVKAEDTLLPPIGAEQPGDDPAADAAGLEWWHWALIVGGSVIVIGLALVVIDQIAQRNKAVGKTKSKSKSKKR